MSCFPWAFLRLPVCSERTLSQPSFQSYCRRDPFQECHLLLGRLGSFVIYHFASFSDWLLVLSSFFLETAERLAAMRLALATCLQLEKKKTSNNRLVSTHCSIHRYVWKNLSVQKCFSPEICEEIFVSFIHMAHFRIKWTDNYKAWVHGAVTKRMSIGLNNMHIANSHEVKYYNRTSYGSLSKTHPPSLPLHPPVNNVQYVI